MYDYLLLPVMHSVEIWKRQCIVSCARIGWSRWTILALGPIAKFGRHLGLIRARAGSGDVYFG
jgi:hypothetical protein